MYQWLPHINHQIDAVHRRIRCNAKAKSSHQAEPKIASSNIVIICIVGHQLIRKLGLLHAPYGPAKTLTGTGWTARGELATYSLLHLMSF